LEKARSHVWRRAASVFFRLAVFGGAVSLLASGVRWNEVGASLRDVSPFLLFFVVALNAVMMGLKALRLRWLLAPQRVTFITCFIALLTSSAINNVVPLRGGDIARLWILERRAGITKAKAAAIAVIERLVDIGALAALAIPVSLYARSQRWATATSSVVLVGSVGLLVLLRLLVKVRPQSATVAISRPRQSYFRTKLAGVARGLAQGATVLKDDVLLSKAVGLSIAIWLVETVMVIVCARALKMVIPIPLAVVTLLGINLALALPSTPANVGPFEAGVVVVLTAAGFAKPQALAFGLVYHLVQVVPVTIAGLAVVASGDFPSRSSSLATNLREPKAIRLEIPVTEGASRGAERT
jgi:glycosyltransferase 2 family protein